jgi:uncharacterized C2H2 Zn-finger protein
MENLFDFDFNGFSNSANSPNDDADYCTEVTRDGKKYHNCTFPNCGKIFRFKSEFMRHRVIHVIERPFNCPHEGCNKSFKREDALKNHIRIHTGEMPFICEVSGCQLSFTTKAGLRYHLLKHKGEKLCTCSHPGCNKSFLTLAQLKQHESATNYHKKVSPASESPEVIVVEKTVTTKCKDDSLDEFFAPDLKPVGKIEWEMKDQFQESNEISNDLQEDFEKMVKVILKENNVLKKRLDMCSTLMNLMQENNCLKDKLSKVSGYDEPSPNISDEKIYSFLNL